jgi:hypothetical protein
MAMHRAVLWPKSTSLLIGILSQSPGYRAAAVHVRVYRFKDGTLPAAQASQSGGRVFAHWYEEARSWRFLTNVTAAPEGIVHDYIGFDRWAQLARFYGANGISALGVGYQDAFWRGAAVEGVITYDYDVCRLLLLNCEKYGLKYMPEFYYSQWYLESKTLPEIAGNDQDFRAISCNGAKTGTNASPCSLNPLYPAVQKAWIDAMGELADKLRDSPAFTGITVRADTWGFRGEYTFASLYWGYGDWTVREFTRDTSIAIPGEADGKSNDDPNRFIHRFEFLTGPEIKPKWVDWRVARILDYHTRILNRDLQAR